MTAVSGPTAPTSPITDILADEHRSVAAVERCLARIEERDETIMAWAHVDPELALSQRRHVTPSNGARLCTEFRSVSRTSSTPMTSPRHTDQSCGKATGPTATPKSFGVCAATAQ